MRWLAPIMGLCFLMLSGGCGRHYLLQGHSEDNLDSPPDITMQVGERRKLFWTGMTLMMYTPSEISIGMEHPGVVELEFPSRGTAYIKAMSAGSTRLHYYGRHNRGFLVTVLPKSKGRRKGDTRQ